MYPVHVFSGPAVADKLLKEVKDSVAALEAKYKQKLQQRKVSIAGWHCFYIDLHNTIYEIRFNLLNNVC